MRNDVNKPTFRAAKIAAAVVVEMQRATRSAKAFAEAQCNYDLGDPDDDKSEYARRYKRQANAAARINERLQHHCLWAGLPTTKHMPKANAARLELGGDPRGACGRLIVPGLMGDGFGEGFAIY